MKRALCFLFTILFTLSALPLAPACAGPDSEKTARQAERELDENELYARSAVLMDAGSGRVLFAKNADTPLPMASTTKIMTCIVTLEHADLNETAEVSAYAAKMPEVKLHMAQGEHYRLKDLLYSLMLESHNDSAVVIAEHTAGSVEQFAQLMNEKAASIGCKDTYFITPNGLDASEDITKPDGTSVTKVHSATAADLAAILSYCITKSPKKEEFLKITRTSTHTFHNMEQAADGTYTQGARSFTCVNHNAFLHMMDGALTGKTGFTGNAGYCYTGALKSEGRTFVIALLACGWPNNKTYKWKDARKLFQYGISNYKQADITNYDYVPRPVPVENGAGKDRLLKTKIQLPLSISQTAQEMLLSEKDSVQVREEIPKVLQAPVKKGERIGSLNYYVNGELAAQMPLTAAREIKERSALWYLKLVVSRYFYPYLN